MLGTFSESSASFLHIAPSSHVLFFSSFHLSEHRAASGTVSTLTVATAVHNKAFFCAQHIWTSRTRNCTDIPTDVRRCLPFNRANHHAMNATRPRACSASYSCTACSALFSFFFFSSSSFFFLFFFSAVFFSSTMYLNDHDYTTTAAAVRRAEHRPAHSYTQVVRCLLLF